MGLKIMAKRLLVMNAVSVSAAMFADAKHAAVLQITYNFLYGAFGNANICGHIPQTGFRITGQADQDMTMITKKCPLIHTIITLLP